MSSKTGGVSPSTKNTFESFDLVENPEKQTKKEWGRAAKVGVTVAAVLALIGAAAIIVPNFVPISSLPMSIANLRTIGILVASAGLILGVAIGVRQKRDGGKKSSVEKNWVLVGNENSGKRDEANDNELNNTPVSKEKSEETRIASPSSETVLSTTATTTETTTTKENGEAWRTFFPQSSVASATSENKSKKSDAALSLSKKVGKKESASNTLRSREIT